MVDEENSQLSLCKPEEVENVKNFAFDHVFGQESQQETVYTKTAYNLVENVLLGYNGTILRMGRRDAGKHIPWWEKWRLKNLKG